MDRPSTALTMAALTLGLTGGMAPLPLLDFTPTNRNGYRTYGTSHKPQSGQKYRRRKRRCVRSGLNTRGL